LLRLIVLACLAAAYSEGRRGRERGRLEAPGGAPLSPLQPPV